MLDTPDQIAALQHDLAPHDPIAVDTEADSLHSYFEKLCLIQIGIPDRDELVDPLAGVDLTPLLALLENKTLVFHGADFDVRMLRRAGAFRPKRVFDTMIAARLVGIHEFSLAALVKQFFGVEMVKGSQKADWSMRPLTAKMMEYARNDTRYLLSLAGKLSAELFRLGRIDWFEQSCARALSGAMVDRDRDIENLWRIKGSYVLNPRANAILRELWRWRDAEAQSMDRPAFKVLRNEDLLTAASESEQGRHFDLRHLRGRRREGFQEAIRLGLEVPESEWPQPPPKTPRPKPNPEFDSRLQKLRNVRDRNAKDLKLDPSVIAPKAAMESIAGNPERAAELLLPWQLELLGIKG